jgi:spore coat protein CotH
MRSVLFCGLAVTISLLLSPFNAAPAASSSATPVAATTRPIPNKPNPDSADALFNDGPLPRLHIEIPTAQLKSLNDNPRTPIHATVRETVPGQPDVVYKDVAVHLKGRAGSFRKTDDKPAFTLNFDKFVPNGRFHGLNKMQLNNSVQDPTYMSEFMASYVFRGAGCPAPRVSNARVWLNGRDLGAYVLKEGFDNVFFKKYFRDRSGNLYEGNYADIDSDLPVHLGEHTPELMGPPTKQQVQRQAAGLAAATKQASVRLRSLVDATRQTDPNKRREQLDKVLDIDHFLTFAVCEAMINHGDGYCSGRNNYRIYDDPRSGKLVFLPQGMDTLFQNPGFPLFTDNGMVAKAVTASIEDRQLYFDRFISIRQTVFTPKLLLAEVDHLSARMLPMMAEISPDAARQHKEMTAQLRQRIGDRISNIDSQLARPNKPLQFDKSGLAKVTQWQPKQQQGGALAEPFEEGGKSLLRITAKSPGAASWRASVLLTQGHYILEGRIKTIAVKSGGGPNSGAGLRKSGEKNRPVHLTGDNDWIAVKYDFDAAESLAEVVLVCELNAASGQAFFDPESLVVRKRP